jgi:hypothetical protein
MPSTFKFCLPTTATTVPDGPDWLHEIKYDGYRLRLERDGDRVRLIIKGRLSMRSVIYPCERSIAILAAAQCCVTKDRARALDVRARLHSISDATLGN